MCPHPLFLRFYQRHRGQTGTSPLPASIRGGRAHLLCRHRIPHMEHLFVQTGRLSLLQPYRAEAIIHGQASQAGPRMPHVVQAPLLMGHLPLQRLRERDGRAHV